MSLFHAVHYFGHLAFREGREEEMERREVNEEVGERKEAEIRGREIENPTGGRGKK